MRDRFLVFPDEQRLRRDVSNEAFSSEPQKLPVSDTYPKPVYQYPAQYTSTYFPTTDSQTSHVSDAVDGDSLTSFKNGPVNGYQAGTGSIRSRTSSLNSDWSNTSQLATPQQDTVEQGADTSSSSTEESDTPRKQVPGDQSKIHSNAVGAAQGLHNGVQHGIPHAIHGVYGDANMMALTRDPHMMPGPYGVLPGHPAAARHLLRMPRHEALQDMQYSYRSGTVTPDMIESPTPSQYGEEKSEEDSDGLSDDMDYKAMIKRHIRELENVIKKHRQEVDRLRRNKRKTKQKSKSASKSAAQTQAAKQEGRAKTKLSASAKHPAPTAGVQQSQMPDYQTKGDTKIKPTMVAKAPSAQQDVKPATSESENLQALTAIQRQHIDSSVRSKVSVSPQHMGAILRRGSDVPKSSTPVSGSRFVHPRSLSQSLSRRVGIPLEVPGLNSRPHTPDLQKSETGSMSSPVSTARPRSQRRKLSDHGGNADGEGYRDQARPHHLPVVAPWIMPSFSGPGVGDNRTPMHSYNQYQPYFHPMEPEYYYIPDGDPNVGPRKTEDIPGGMSEAQHTQKRLSGQSDKSENKPDQNGALQKPQGAPEDNGRSRDKGHVDKSIASSESKRKPDMSNMSFPRHLPNVNIPPDQRYPGIWHNYYTYHGEPSYNQMSLPPQWAPPYYGVQNMYVPQRRANEMPNFPVQGAPDQVLPSDRFVQRPHPFTPSATSSASVPYGKVPAQVHQPLPQQFLNYGPRHMPHTPDMPPYPYPEQRVIDTEDWDSVSNCSERSATNRMPT